MDSSSDHSGEKQRREEDEFASPVNSAVEKHVRFDAARTKKMMWKIDLKLVPFLSLLYLLSFLDRVNIGQARLAGLEADLGLTGNQYQIALIVFFVGYVITEVPSNILLKVLRPSRYIPAVMVAWGLVMTCMGVVEGFGGLVATRFILGLFESALFPGICFFLTMWYKRREANFRISIFFSSATLAGAFGGILAYGISQMDGVGGRGGWAWIFIIEGIITVVVALAAPFLMTDFPEDSKFLDPDEKAEVIARLREDQGTAGEAGFAWSHIWAAAKDWRVYVYMLIYIGIAEPLYALSLFVPTIIASLGTWTRPQSMLLSTPPYVVAFIVTLCSALYSDRIGHRGWFNVFWMSFVVTGYSILMGVNPREQPGVAYFAVFLTVAGVSPCISNTITWIGGNTGPSYKRGTAMGMMFTLGNSGGIVSSIVYPAKTAPRFYQGHGICLGFAAMALFLSLFLTFNLKYENRRRDRLYGQNTVSQDDIADGNVSPEQIKAWGLEGMSQEEMTCLGDRHPSFRYIE